jgi:thymidylate synthase
MKMEWIGDYSTASHYLLWKWNGPGSSLDVEWIKKENNMNKLDKQYTDLLQDILDNGVIKQDRTNTGTISVFGRQIRHKMSDGFPLLTTKKMPFKIIVTELLWFLRGDTNIKYLVDNNCHIWDGDAYKNYCNAYPDAEKTFQYEGSTIDVRKMTQEEFINEIKTDDEFAKKWGDTNIKYLVDNNCHIWDGDCFSHYQKEFKKLHYHTAQMSKEEFIERIKTDDEFAKKWGELGPIYGKQWRKWKAGIGIGHAGNPDYILRVDQIENLLEELETNPDSRRLMVNAWNVGEIGEMILPPCHYSFQVYTREIEWYNDLDKIKKIYVNWSLSKGTIGYAGDLKADTVESANQIFNDGWQNRKDPFTGKPLIELECFSSIPKRAISLMWNQRSVDTFLGLPFNIASYGLLLEILAKVVNMVPDELIGNLGDTHLYSDHIEQAKEQIGRELSHNERCDLFGHNDSLDRDYSYSEWLDNNGYPKRTREPFELPALNINTEFWPTEGGECGIGPISGWRFLRGLDNDDFIRCLLEEDIQLVNYKSHPSIKAPLSN